MSEEEIKKTLDEAKILEKLDHPNIIRFIESYVVNGHKKSLCIVMDFADGIFKFILDGDLKNKLDSRNGRFLQENTVLDIFLKHYIAI